MRETAWGARILLHTVLGQVGGRLGQIGGRLGEVGGRLFERSDRVCTLRCQTTDPYLF
jgi:hypothetical protein